MPNPSAGHRSTLKAATGLTLGTLLMVVGACVGQVEDQLTGAGSPEDDPIERSGSAPNGPVFGGPGGIDTTPCDPDAPIDPGPAPLQRLTPAQYRATVQQLFGEHLTLTDELPESRSVSHIGLVQADTSQVEVESYATAARVVARDAASNVQRVAPCQAGGDAAAASQCARDFLRSFGTRIYRKPLADADVEGLIGVFNVGYGDGDYAHGIELMLEAMLQSPRFLYRPEFGDPSRAADGAVPLTEYELASRLSFAFWNRGPDQELLEAARNGSLGTPQGLAQQASRLIDDSRAQDSFEEFMHVWFGLSELDTLEKDPDVYPVWSEATREELKTQRDAFFRHALFGPEGSLQALFSTDPADFAGEQIQDWNRAAKGESPGVLALPALLSAHSKPGDSFPIYRGLLVREQLLCQPLPPPPENVGEPPEPEAGVSTRQRFEQHSSDPSCRGCHELIDPLGFAFENYDALGRYRLTDEGHTVDASGELLGTDVDGPFEDLSELATKLAESDTVRACATRQWFRYVMQRFEQPADACSVEALSETFAESDYRFESLRSGIVQTPAFRMRRMIAPEENSP